MSKIGRKPISIGDVQIDIKGSAIHYKGKKNSGVYELPEQLEIELKDKNIYLKPKKDAIEPNQIWGLTRALLSNKIKGAQSGFEKQLKINGLGYKAVLNGNNLQFSLGFSHKIDYELPAHINVIIDKTGQLLTFQSFDKEILGQVCGDIRALRPPEPYKGTGIQYVKEVIRRKAGKTKSA